MYYLRDPLADPEIPPFLLEALDKRADKPALDAIGFEKDEGALHWGFLTYLFV